MKSESNPKMNDQHAARTKKLHVLALDNVMYINDSYNN